MFNFIVDTIDYVKYNRLKVRVVGPVTLLSMLLGVFMGRFFVRRIGSTLSCLG